MGLRVGGVVLQWMQLVLQGFIILLMDKILHDLEDSKLWELWYIPYNG